MGEPAPARIVRPEPLSAARLLAAAGRPGALWTDIRVVSQTGSTNADVLAFARSGAAEGLVIAAEAQTAGRGRQKRSWVSLPGAALTFSVLLRPASVPPSARGWIPLLAGVATAAAIESVTGVAARLKWPNDVLAGDGKLAGILAEQYGSAVAVGIGINVMGRAADLPVPSATSLELHGACLTDRNDLLAEILRQFESWYLRWAGSAGQATGGYVTSGGATAAGATAAGATAAGATAAGATAAGATAGDADTSGLRAEYLRLCATVGRRVRVELPGGTYLTGTAAGVDEAGQLLISRDGEGVTAVSAGDVVHVR